MLAETAILEESSALRREGMPNYHVGPASQRDVWVSLPVWTVEVGHIVILRTDDSGEPWFLGEVLEVIENGKERFGEHGEYLRVHEMGKEIKLEGKTALDGSLGSSRPSASTLPSNWKFNGVHWYRYTTIGRKGGRKNARMDVYLPMKSDLPKYVPVITPCSRDAVAWWGPRDQVLTAGNRLLAPVLKRLDANSSVRWSLPKIPVQVAGKKRSCAASKGPKKRAK